MKQSSIKPFPIDYKILVDSGKYPMTYLQQNLHLPESKAVKLTIRHSKHSRRRAAQRSIDYKLLWDVLTYGTPYPRQGLTFYTVLDKDIPDDILHWERSKMKNLIVVMNSINREVITCYYSKNASKHLKLKGKEFKVRRA